MDWEKIRRFTLDDPDAGYRFSDRLAHENGWSLLFALRAMEEYKRFVYLMCLSPEPLSPSHAVDQVWHLHLLYTRSYWDDLCENTLGRKIHHGPTKGGPTEQRKFAEWYQQTLDLYAQTFGHSPPDDIWPPAHRRAFKSRYRWVDLNKYWTIPKFW
jgi:hypothetical protein